MDYIFFQTTAVNGFDGISHYLRAELLTNLCSLYTTQPAPGCNSNFTETKSIGGSKRSAKSVQRLRAKLRAGGSTIGPAPAPRKGSGHGGTPGSVNPFDVLRELVNPAIRQQRDRGVSRLQRGASGKSDPSTAALNFLLGSEAP
jgi:hypothetical protein